MVVLLHNTGTRPDNTADYDVEVRVNHDVIWRGHVDNHDCSHGWQALLRQLADSGASYD